MSAPSVPTGPPLGRGMVPALTEFLATLPPEADVTDWTATTGGRSGWVELTVTVLFPMSDEGNPS